MDMATLRIAALVMATVVFFALTGTNAHGQSGGALFLGADPDANSREFWDTPGLRTIYIVHKGFQAGAEFSAVRFKVDNHGFTGTWVGDTSDFGTIGNSQTGIAVNYSGCMEPPILVLSVSYFCAGTSDCTTVGLAADPFSESGWIESYDCVNELLSPPYVYELCVNGVLVPDDTGFGYCDCPVPVEQTTWGQIKAVYE
jgi:hypothetical protein